MFANKKGYRVERKIKGLFQESGWYVIRAGRSLGPIDLVCIKNKKCILVQVKSTKKKTFYYYDYKGKKFEGFPFFLIVDFGYGKIRILSPQERVKEKDGRDIEEILMKINTGKSK